MNSLALLLMCAPQFSEQAVYIPSEKLADQYVQAIQLIKGRKVARVFLQMEFSGTSEQGVQGLRLSQNWISVAKCANENSVKVSGVVSLTRFQSWMASFLRPEHYELDLSMRLTKNEAGRYLNSEGVALANSRMLEALNASACKLDTIYLDLRYPIYPILACSESSRVSSIISDNIDPIDVESPKLDNVQQWLSGLSEDNRQFFLRFCESRQQRLKAVAEAIVSKSSFVDHWGFIVSEGHFGIDPILRLVEGSAFFESKKVSAFDRLLIVPSTANISQNKAREDILRYFSGRVLPNVVVTCISDDSQLIESARRQFVKSPIFEFATQLDNRNK